MATTIQIRLDGSGMGPGSTRADAEAYAEFVEWRLGMLYPNADINVELVREGEPVSRSVIVDETEFRDVDDTMVTLWDQFCADTSLWPSTTPTT